MKEEELKLAKNLIFVIEGILLGLVSLIGIIGSILAIRDIHTGEASLKYKIIPGSRKFVLLSHGIMILSKISINQISENLERN